MGGPLRGTAAADHKVYPISCTVQSHESVCFGRSCLPQPTHVVKQLPCATARAWPRTCSWDRCTVLACQLVGTCCCRLTSQSMAHCMHSRVP